MPRTPKTTAKASAKSKSDLVKIDKVPHPTSKPTLTEVGGTKHVAFNGMLVRQAFSSCTTVERAPPDYDPTDAMLAGLREISPRDAQEGMMATQMLGLHNATMECVARQLR
jgi:hypothetical protein